MIIQSGRVVSLFSIRKPVVIRVAPARLNSPERFEEIDLYRGTVPVHQQYAMPYGIVNVMLFLFRSGFYPVIVIDVIFKLSLTFRFIYS